MRSGVVKASLIVLALAAAGGVAYRYVGLNGVKAAPQPAAPRGRAIPVVTAKVERRTVPMKIDVVGRAEAFATVPIRARVDGQIVSVAFQPGQHVKKDQVLIELDRRPLDAQLRQAKGNLARDQALLAKARADLERYQDLARKGFVSASAVDGYRATVETTEGTVQLDQAAVDFAQVQLGFATMRAPMDGVVGAIQVYPGGNVKANDTVIAVLNQMQPVYVTFSIPESQLDSVKELARKGPVTINVRTRDSTSATLTGKLTFIDNAIDTSTGTIVLKATFPNADERLTPGQFVDVSIVTKEIPDAVVMPVEAMQMGPNGNIVFVVKADNSVEVRPVKESTVAGKTLVVPSGFQPGETVVIDGQLRLSPGATIDAKPAGKPST